MKYSALHPGKRIVMEYMRGEDVFLYSYQLPKASPFAARLPMALDSVKSPSSSSFKISIVLVVSPVIALMKE